MFNFVQGSKYRTETISIVVSFADILPAGNAITGIPLVTVTVFSGVDPVPSNLLYGGVSIYNGITIEQRIRLGVDGCIYHITFSILTTGGDTLEKETYLAILPNEDNAIPGFFPIWLTSNLYPYTYQENITNSIGNITGRILQMPQWTEPVQASIAPLYGTLIGSSISYANPHEDVQNAISLLYGTLVGSFVLYDIPHEDIKHNIAPLYGTLVGTAVSYNNPHEDMQVSITPISGTLL